MSTRKIPRPDMMYDYAESKVHIWQKPLNFTPFLPSSFKSRLPIYSSSFPRLFRTGRRIPTLMGMGKTLPLLCKPDKGGNCIPCANNPGICHSRSEPSFIPLTLALPNKSSPLAYLPLSQFQMVLLTLPGSNCINPPNTPFALVEVDKGWTTFRV